MKQVHVSASKDYDVLIGSNILPSLGNYVASLCSAQKACIVSDSNVFPLYGDIVRNSLRQAGFQSVSYVLPAGEASKNASTYVSLLSFLAESQITRSDMIIALGGGVVGDLAGFAAATYLRGIPFIQVPTTLLAAVDSSVGGKTAIDLPAGKNLVGAFYQPSFVLCDTDTLRTLPENVFHDGCAEVIKYGVLYDAEFFSYLESAKLNFDREKVIARCVELKRNVVNSDEFDTGERMKLNLGHTIGHGIEAASGFTISHGEAVAIGMVIIASAVGCPDTDRIRNCLEAFSLPTRTSYSAETLLSYALSDKKRSGNVIKFIVPEHIGSCSIIPVPTGEVKSFIEKGL